VSGNFSRKENDMGKQTERWRAEDQGDYWYINTCGHVMPHIETGSFKDWSRYNFGNYFQTQELAEEMLQKLKMLLISSNN